MSTTSAVLPWLGICLKKKITRKQEKRKETGKTAIALLNTVIWIYKVRQLLQFHLRMLFRLLCQQHPQCQHNYWHQQIQRKNIEEETHRSICYCHGAPISNHWHQQYLFSSMRNNISNNMLNTIIHQQHQHQHAERSQVSLLPPLHIRRSLLDYSCLEFLLPKSHRHKCIIRAWETLGLNNCRFWNS